MFLTLALCLSADPTFTVTNLCPPALTVSNHCPAPVAAIKTGYPVHPTRWTYPGEIHSHLKSGQHSGKWPAWWIDTLTRQQAESLHDDDHEGRVKWDFVSGRASTKTTSPSPPPVVRSLPAYCPPGASH
jgi:hypothetical protein